jgi:hypothetical protein
MFKHCVPTIILAEKKIKIKIIIEMAVKIINPIPSLNLLNRGKI